MFGRNMRVKKKDEKVLNLRKRLPLIEFHKEAIKDYWRFLLLRKEALGRALGFLVLIFILGSFFYTEANVATFYADTCLGGWQNSNNASGKPEVADGGADFVACLKVTHQRKVQLYLKSLFLSFLGWSLTLL